MDMDNSGRLDRDDISGIISANSVHIDRAFLVLRLGASFLVEASNAIPSLLFLFCDLAVLLTAKYSQFFPAKTI